MGFLSDSRKRASSAFVAPGMGGPPPSPETAAASNWSVLESKTGVSTKYILVWSFPSSVLMFSTTVPSALVVAESDTTSLPMWVSAVLVEEWDGGNAARFVAGLLVAGAAGGKAGAAVAAGGTRSVASDEEPGAESNAAALAFLDKVNAV